MATQMIIAILLSTANYGMTVKAEFQLHDVESSISRGKKSLDELEARTKLPRHSDCWREAVSSLKGHCMYTNDQGQSYLAIRLANCHLARSGLETFPCKEMDDIEDCTKAISKDTTAFIVYTEFFTHVTDICFYLQSELWRDKTSGVISKLTETSSEIASELSKSLAQQENLLQGQDTSLKNQEEMLRYEKLLKASLQDSAESVQGSFAKMREEAKMQRDLYSETFTTLFQSVDKLTKLQNLLLGEFMGFQSFAFYLISVLVCYVLTSTPRTSGARLPLLMLLTLLIFCERYLTSWVTTTDGSKSISTEDYHQKIWFLRKVFLLIMTLTIGYIALSYRDLNQMNNQMLKSIEYNILEIKRLQLMYSPQVNVPGKTQSICQSSKENVMKRLVRNEALPKLSRSFTDGPEVIDCTVTDIPLHCISDDEDGVEITDSSINTTMDNTHLTISQSIERVVLQKSRSRKPRKQSKQTNQANDEPLDRKYNLRVRSRNSLETATHSVPKASTEMTPKSSKHLIGETPNSSSKNKRTGQQNRVKKKLTGKAPESRPFFSSDEEDVSF